MPRASAQRRPARSSRMAWSPGLAAHQASTEDSPGPRSHAWMVAGTAGGSTTCSQLVPSSALAAGSPGPKLRISSATGAGTTNSGATSCNRLRRPARVRKMSGEALTAGRSATTELALQIVEVDRNDVHTFARQSHQEVSPVEPGDLGGFLLGDLASLVPMDRGCQPEFAAELLGRAPQCRED